MRMKQLGISLGGLMVGAVIFIVLAMLGMKLGPSYLEFASIKKAVVAIAQEKAGASVNDVRKAFDARASQVLDLAREWNQLTQLPMIFALWAARPGALTPEDVQEITRAAQYGLGIRTGVDLGKVVDIGQWICGVIGKEPASKAGKAIAAKKAR